MSLIKRWGEYAKQYGWGGLVRYVAARLVRSVWERSLVQFLYLDKPVPPVAAKVPLRVEVLPPERAQLAPGCADPAAGRRWAQGDVCYIAWRDTECVHYSWVSRVNSPVDEVHGILRVAAGEAYIYSCFTSGEHRGLGIFPAVLSLIEGELFASGVQRVWIAVEAENVASAKAIRRAGFLPAGTVSYRRVGSSVKRSVRREPGAPPFELMP